MNIQHLKYALEVARSGSISKASEKLLMGQPNLSRAIKELEESIGITIFERSAKGIFLTAEGEEFLSHAKKILNQIEEVENIYKTGFTHKQNFSVSAPRASYISDAFSHFSKNLKSIPSEILYEETDSSKTLKSVMQSKCNLGIIRYAANHDKICKEMLEEKGLSYELISEFKYVLVMNSRCPLAGLSEIHFGDLAPYIEITHEEPFFPFLPLSEMKKDEISNCTSRKICVFERACRFDLLFENSETFMWVSPVPKNILNRYGLVQKYCLDNNKIYRDVLIYRKNYRFTKLDKAFITELCNSKRNIL